MSAESVLALIDAFCGTPESKILSSILDQPSRSLLCGRRFMASLSPLSLLLHMLWLKLPTLAILTILSSETVAERQTIASESLHFLLRLFIQRDAVFEKHTSVIQLAVYDLTICWKISVSSQGEALDFCAL